MLDIPPFQNCTLGVGVIGSPFARRLLAVPRGMAIAGFRDTTFVNDRNSFGGGMVICAMIL